uniref:Uncharacterized protein n=1 Tax=Octopus bimaculoides TaxID=37653 RepID=A0A0L8FR59_OCTBM
MFLYSTCKFCAETCCKALIKYKNLYSQIIFIITTFILSCKEFCIYNHPIKLLWKIGITCSS